MSFQLYASPDFVAQNGVPQSPSDVSEFPGIVLQESGVPYAWNLRNDGRGVNAVVVEGAGIDAETLHQVALHIAFAKPAYLNSDEVPAEEIEAERTSLLEITKAEGKPEQAWDKIVSGRLQGWLGERVLLEQGLHGDKTAVKDSLGGGSIVRFVQVLIGG